jgi:PAS domain S-box-containing protein
MEPGPAFLPAGPDAAAILDAVDVGVLVWDADDRLTFWNARYLAIFPHMDGLVVRGMDFAAYVAATAGRLRAMGMPERAAWVETERAARHRRFGRSYRQRVSFDRAIETAEFATPDGGCVAVYRDVTDMAAAEAARAESEGRFRSLVASVDGAVYRRRLDARGTMEFASPGIAGLTGYPADEFVGPMRRSYAELVHPDDRAAVAARIAEAVAGRHGFEVEYRLVRRDGKVAWALEKGRPAEAEDGTVAWVDGIVVDQTERRRREGELERSRLAVAMRDLRFRDAIESMADGLLLYDADDRVVAWNERYLEFFPHMRGPIRTGMPAIEVVLAHAAARHPQMRPDELDAYARARLRAIRRAPMAPEDVVMGARTFQTVRQRTSDGGLVALLRDVTAERAASRRVRESEARFRDAIASMADGFLQVGPELRVVAWNQRYLDYYPALRGAIREGLDLREALRVVGATEVPIGNLEAWIETRLAALRPETFVETEAMRIGGRDVRITRTRTADGGAVAIIRDVTADVATAREIERARDAAEVASRAKTEFLANMSHELRTPLNGVVGMLDVMLGAGLAPEHVAQARMARASAERLLQVIGDILDITKLEAGALQVERVTFDPARVLADAASTFAAGAAAKGLSLSVAVGPGVEGPAAGDPGRTGQVLLNLIGNAVKFTESGGVRVEARRPGGAPERVVFSVIDSGPGIDAGVKQRLFAKFFQADGSITRRFGGTGLGLAISRELAVAMGGDIKVRDAAGGGSVFEFSLPLPPADPVPEAAAPPPAPPAGRWTGRRVLLVEDNDVNRYAAAKMLEALDVTIDEAVDGEAALARALEVPYDLILMDVQMPRMDGLEATRRIRAAAGPNRTAPILALTANAFVEDVARCREAGMDDHVAKPVRAATLRAAVDRMLERAAASGAPRAVAPSDPPAVPAAAFEAIEADMPPATVRALVRAFRSEQGRQVAELPVLAAAGAFDKVVLAAHSIRGAAALFGAADLAARALSAERAARARAAAPLQEAAAGLDAAFRAVDAALHARYPDV